ncbi:LOW QUALITY PROTEIN: hypothetical protein DH2020_038909 [Rehmannia glutinosa]|uniref:C2 domain-containing protein n=1 Tax=Rehmannia glutinosa TaxID=99300 RepID=A0ABR0UYD3_REHGL
MSTQDDYKIKDTKPQLGERWPHGGVRGGGGWISSERTASTYDLVEQMYYLYVRVVKARDLPPNPVNGNCDPYVEVKLGNYKGKTQRFEKKTNPEWNQVFAFSKEKIHSSVLEVFVRDREMVGRDDYLGKVVFDMNEVPTRVPPDSPLAPQWYRLEDRRGESKLRGEVMLAVWMGTQADEAFPDSWHSDAASVHGEAVRSKVYVSPKLWYLRVNVIEAQDIESEDKSQLPQVFVKAQVGNQILKTRLCPNRTTNPFWNEDLVFVAAEPFEEQLVLTVENKVAPTKDELVGRISLPLHIFERLDHRPVHSRWFNLERFGFGVLEGDRRTERKFSTRIHLRACLEGGYHVLDESTMYISDQRPTARQLWKQPIGILESSVSPKWNEQYTWEVYDPCTVITLGVFDNCHLGSSEKPDSRIGKVRSVSTLETDRIYTHSYPLLVLQPSGLKKTGELQLAFRFTCLSLAHMVYLYSRPLLPKMHYLHPFTVGQLDSLRYQAMNIVASRLGRAEPPLRKEVVEYMLDVDSHMWSMRRSKANFFRIVSLFSGFVSMSKWISSLPMEKSHHHHFSAYSVLHTNMLPELILPTAFLYMFLIGLWNFRFGRDIRPTWTRNSLGPRRFTLTN